MGSKGSFAIASLTHHCLVHYAAYLIKDKLIGLNINDLYEIVGDDLVIHHEALKDQIMIIYDLIDIEVSKAKSKVPVGNTYWAEFCSRVFVNGKDVSRISPNVINRASKD